jgi:hypothetical protein
VRITRRNFVKLTALTPLSLPFAASAQDVVITFTVHSQSAFARTIEFWDLANNSHATIGFAPNGNSPLSLLTRGGGDGRMKYRFVPNTQWYEHGWIKAGSVVNV